MANLWVTKLQRAELVPTYLFKKFDEY
jgi:hypothetical protein